jgi:hypothetical protein
VVERPRGLGFQLEARKAVAVCSQIFGEELDRHVTPELRVGGSIDFPHRASRRRACGLDSWGLSGMDSASAEAPPK